MVFVLTVGALLLGIFPEGAVLQAQESATTDSVATAKKPGAAVSATDPLEDLGALEPEDGEWLVGEDDRKYILKSLPKNSGDYRWIDDKKIRYKRWYTFTVAKQDDENIYIKIFKPADVPVAASKEAIDKKEREEQEAIAAQYLLTVGESDRLQFSSFDDGLPKHGMWRNGFDVADVNGDGNLDIVHGPARKGSLIPRVFLGDGQGGWEPWTDVQYPRAPYDYGDATAADFNGDGLMDLAFGFHLRGVLAIIQYEPGKFRPWSRGLDLEVPGTGGSAAGFSTRELEVVDWNGDGRPDLLTVGEGPRPAGSKDGKRVGIISSHAYGGVVYLNNGDGSWTRVDQGLQRNGVFGDSVAAGDFDGDGRLDFVTASNVLNRRDVLNLGNPDDVTWESHELELFRPWALIQGVAAEDFNEDGRDDFAFGFASWQKKVWRTGVDVFLSQGEKGWERITLMAEEGRESVWAVASGDLDGDGHKDLAASTSTGRVMVFLGDGVGAFSKEASPEIVTPSGCRGYKLRMADVDADGKDELLGSFAGEGSALPMAQFPEMCPSGGEIAVWRASPSTAENQQATLDM